MRAAHIKSIAETVSLQGYSNGIKAPKDPVMISYLLIADPLNLIDTYDATADWFAPHDSYHVIRLDNYPPPTLPPASALRVRSPPGHRQFAGHGYRVHGAAGGLQGAEGEESASMRSR